MSGGNLPISWSKKTIEGKHTEQNSFLFYLKTTNLILRVSLIYCTPDEMITILLAEHIFYY